MNRQIVHFECLCGGVRIEARLPSRKMGHCFCNNCRRAQGAGVWTWVTFDEQQVRIVEGEERLSQYASETGAVRSFCGRCGSTMMFRAPRWPGVIDLSVANAVGDLDRAPDRNVYADRRLDWCPIDAALPSFGGPDGHQP